VIFLDEIPKTATGKFSKQRLRSRYVTDDQRSAQQRSATP
jgi:acyl-CoA synthetase (AMP-forming)/AMP-acid ligase II